MDHDQAESTEEVRNTGSVRMETPVLEVRGIRKRFFATQALDGVSLAVRPGTVHAIVGENGAGKSTLMNIIGGVHQADEGHILMEGREVAIHSPSDAFRLGIGFVHQEIALCQHISVAENIFMPHSGEMPGIVPFASIESRTRKLLAEFEGHSKIDPRQKVSGLSVSQQQVIEIVKSLSLNCRIIIFDEPTAALTQSETEALFKIILKLKEKGLGILYISHRLAEIFRIADEVSVLRDGCLIDTLALSGMTQEKLVGLMVGRELTDIYPAKAPEGTRGTTILEVENLGLAGTFSSVSFSLSAGEILGFAGLVGSGRTEVMRTLCGLYRKNSGTVRLLGRELHISSYRDAIRAGIVYLTENRAQEGLFLELSVARNISAMDLGLVSRKGLIGAGREKSLARRYAQDMSIKVADVEQKVNSLSGGNQQKVLISKLLALGPKVVIMDEPTRGIDIGAKAQIYHLLRRLAAEGIGVIVISSELPEVVGLCDRVAVMYEGSLCGFIEGADIGEQSIIRMACLSGNDEEAGVRNAGEQGDVA